MRERLGQEVREAELNERQREAKYIGDCDYLLRIQSPN